jgi:nitrite reductase/ring-hydroxylating ferredoxin subunit
MKHFVDVCGTDEVREGEGRMFVVKDDHIGIYHVRGEYFAIQDPCPHAGASLALGFLRDHVVTCRIHHWRFCIQTGEYLDQKKPSCDVRTYPVRVIEDRVQVEV